MWNFEVNTPGFFLKNGYRGKELLFEEDMLLEKVGMNMIVVFLVK